VPLVQEMGSIIDPRKTEKHGDNELKKINLLNHFPP